MPYSCQRPGHPSLIQSRHFVMCKYAFLEWIQITLLTTYADGKSYRPHSGSFSLRHCLHVCVFIPVCGAACHGVDVRTLSNRNAIEQHNPLEAKRVSDGEPCPSWSESCHCQRDLHMSTANLNVFSKELGGENRDARRGLSGSRGPRRGLRGEHE